MYIRKKEQTIATSGNIINDSTSTSTTDALSAAATKELINSAEPKTISYNDLTDKPTIPREGEDLYQYEMLDYARTLCGWYISADDGTNMTEEYGLTPEVLEGVVVGKGYAWPSTLVVGGQVSGICTKLTYGYGTNYRGNDYHTKSFYIGDTYYNYVYDDTKVFKGYAWPDDDGEEGLACFTEETLVWTPEGYTKIADIKVGDEVMSFNRFNERVEPTKVIKIVSHMADNIYSLKIDGEAINATATHPFNTATKGIAPVKVIKKDDELIDNKGKTYKVLSNKAKKNSAMVYEIATENKNYFITNKNISVYCEPSVMGE